MNKEFFWRNIVEYNPLRIVVSYEYTMNSYKPNFVIISYSSGIAKAP